MEAPNPSISKWMPACGLEQDIRGELIAQWIRDRPLIEKFCNMYYLNLTMTDWTDENSDVEIDPVTFEVKRITEWKVELMYVFDDGLGGYTHRGIINSLED